SLKKLTGLAMILTAIAVVATGTVLRAQPEPPRARDQGRGRPASDAGDRDLARLVRGEIVRQVPVAKDCMVLSYLPKWAHGEVDNLAVANNDGGVRTLVDWWELGRDVATSADRVYLALYSRKTTAVGSAGSIQAFPVLDGWP